jgi:hypothetical protein
MNYKTIALELLEQNQPLYHHLRRCRTLLATVERSAAELRTSHREWITRLAETGRAGSSEQTSSEAMEVAVAELTERLRHESEGHAGDGPSLPSAMAYLQAHSRRG